MNEVTAALGRTTSRARAATVGALGALLALALSAAMALGLARVAHGHTGGLLVVAVALVARIALALALAAFDDTSAARARALARRALSAHLLAPHRANAEGAGDLLVSVEDAAQGASLERLRAAAAASVLGLVVVGYYAGWLALAITVALLGAAGPLYRRAGARAEAAQVAVRERRARLEARQLEVLRHVPELRGVGALDYGARELGALSEREHEVALSAIRVALESSAVTEFLSGVSVGLVAMVVGFALLGGRLSLGAALVAVLVTGELYVQVRRYGVEFHRRENATTALARLGGLAGPTRADPAGDAVVVARALVTEARPDPVDLELTTGGTLLLTGPSGSGKTTLLETLVGWRRPVAGALERGPGPVAVVTPSTALLAVSLRENLTLGRTVDDHEVRALLGALALTGERFEDLDTPLDADGRGLSTGERVRVVLARGLLAGAHLVVLDDVGAVLDDDARAAVRAVLSRAGGPAVLEATSGVAVLTEAPRRALET
ncbi:MAG TPA: ATP-binding cassette domain-containing protein [Acidimicrobiales bacterium]|nr:ATP-binding cassette domain-containing protein [Acidimicrobiales bacterium]